MNELMCLHTRNPLLHGGEGSAVLTDPGGKYSYPLLGRVPVLVGNPDTYMTEMFYQYGAYCHKQEVAAGKLATPFQGVIPRRKAAIKLKEGMTVNTGLLREMIWSVEPFFSKRDLLNVAVSNTFSEMEQVKAFQYLKRDWCGLPEDESQIRIVTEAIRDAMSGPGGVSGPGGMSGARGKASNALFLGAGAGRIACELSAHFSHTYATDLALPMAFFFDKILAGEKIDFFDINLSQILWNDDTARKMQASAAATNMKAPQLEAVRDSVTYFIADACSLPMQSNSMDCIISVYFTDVVPFVKVFPEINRVLKKGGLFIHFGPFANNFSSLQAMFSAEDIRDYLSGHGYTGVYDGQVHTEHMKTRERIITQTYDNWVFAARKDSPALEEIGENLNDDSILGFNSPVQLSISGEFGTSGSPWRYNLYNSYKGKEYEDAEEVIRLLKIIDGERTMGDVAGIYLGTSGSDISDSRQQIRGLIRFLIKEGVLTVKNGIV